MMHKLLLSYNKVYVKPRSTSYQSLREPPEILKASTRPEPTGVGADAGKEIIKGIMTDVG